MLSCCSALRNELTTRGASSHRLALMIAAFSRARIPIRPILDDSVIDQVTYESTTEGVATHIDTTGTISGDDRSSCGSLVEITENGTVPISIGGRDSTFLEDGDEVVITAAAHLGGGSTASLGDVRGRVGLISPLP